MSEKIIPIDAPDLVRKLTVTGFVSTDGRFYGDDEHLARWASCTHVRCACGALARKSWTACDECRERNDIARYAALPKVEWDGKSFIYSDAADRYFSDYDELVDFIRDRLDENHALKPDDLRLMICEPNMPGEIDPDDYFADDLPEDGEVPDELREAVEALNAVIRKSPPLSWTPGKKAAIVTIDPADLSKA